MPEDTYGFSLLIQSITTAYFLFGCRAINEISRLDEWGHRNESGPSQREGPELGGNEPGCYWQGGLAPGMTWPGKDPAILQITIRELSDSSDSLTSPPFWTPLESAVTVMCTS